MIAYKSINHLNTSLKDRETYFKELKQENEPSVFLQTCNRMELYYGDGDVPKNVARHLFRVVCGLESAIVGERAVQGQVKDQVFTSSLNVHLRLESEYAMKPKYHMGP